MMSSNPRSSSSSSVVYLREGPAATVVVAASHQRRRNNFLFPLSPPLSISLFCCVCGGKPKAPVPAPLPTRTTVGIITGPRAAIPCASLVPPCPEEPSQPRKSLQTPCGRAESPNRRRCAAPLQTIAVCSKKGTDGTPAIPELSPHHLVLA